MNLSVITQVEQFRSLKEEWNALLKRVPRPSVYMTWEWLFTWWEVFGSDRGLHIILARDKQGKLTGLAPFVISRKRVGRILSRNVLEFLGSGEDRRDEVCSNYLDVLSEDTNSEVLQLIHQHLQEGLNRKEWDEIHWRGSPEDSLFLNATVLKSIHQPHINGRNFHRVLQSSDCAVIELPRSWEEYLSSLSKKWRDQIKRGRKEIAALGSVRSVNVTETHEIVAAFKSFQELHQQKWGAQGQSGLFTSRRFTAFHQKILERFAENRWVSVRLLHLNERIVAASHKLEFAGTVYFYLPAYDQSVSTKIGLGLIERSYDIEDAIKRGFCFYDFYKAREGSYKWHLAKDKRGVCDVLISPKDWKFYLINQLRRVRGVLKGEAVSG